MLAQRLGLPFYDKALINALTEMYHLRAVEKTHGGTTENE